MIDPGNIAEWVSVVLSSAALIAAFFAWKETKRLNQIELGRDEQYREQERAAQAKLVNAWVVAHHDAITFQEKEWGVILDNKSHSPIFRVAVEALDKEGERYASVEYNILPPGQYYLRFKEDPMKRVNFHFPCEVSSYANKLQVMTKGKRAVASLSFHDANNQTWTRKENGQLLAA